MAPQSPSQANIARGSQPINHLQPRHTVQVSPNSSIPPPQQLISRGVRPTQAAAYASANQPRRGSQKGKQSAGKPILDWISRKLAGRRATFSTPETGSTSQLGNQRVKGNDHGQTLTPIGAFAGTPVSIGRSESHSLRSYSVSYANSTERDRRRELNNPYPSIPVPPHRTSFAETYSMAPSNSFFDRSRSASEASLGSSRLRISLAEGGRGADEDASLRPIPPSHNGSPTPSPSFRSHPSAIKPGLEPTSPRQTTQSTSSSGFNPSFASSKPSGARRDSASTKPTTVLSFDSGPHVAHIAQAPPFPTVTIPRSPSPSPGSTPISSPAATMPDSPLSTFPDPTTRAPKHTHPDPRDNPKPSDTPDPNSSTITLASSTFALRPSHASPQPITTPSRLRDQANTTHRMSLATSPSVTWAPVPGGDGGLSPPPMNVSDRPVSLYDAYPPSAALSHSFRTGGWSGAPGGSSGRADRDASVRAVRRKGSWESYESGWSWRAAGVFGPETGLKTRTSMLVPDAEIAGGPGAGLGPPIRDSTPPTSLHGAKSRTSRYSAVLGARGNDTIVA